MYKSFHRLVSPIAMWGILLIGLFLVRLVPLEIAVLPHTWWLTWLSLPALCYWSILAGAALRVHRQASASVGGVTTLVTHGIYSRVRHPMYSANIVAAWGIFLILPTMRVLIGALWATLLFMIWSVLEEQALAEKFGDTYRQYMRRVPRFIPRIFNEH